MGQELLMSTLVDGSASGFASARQARFTDWLRLGTIIPVTARSREVLARVNIEQSPAICANGGCILTDEGSVDLEWHKILCQQSAEHETVSDLHARIGEHLNRDTFRHWVVTVDGTDMYFVIKANGEDDSALDRAEEVMLAHCPQGWRIHRNSNNLALLPPWLNKRHAVTWLLNRARDADPYLPAIGVGDSLSDVGFMDLCDFAMTPTNSQVWQVIKGATQWCS
jgi:hydroxymethylpyrimidine pyrophosphatase-like HAD family hydrolase